jgi:hypothetical protein
MGLQSKEIKRREEVLNVTLAQILCELGIVADPERIFSGPQIRKHMPDVLVEFYGLRIMIEGKIGGKPDSKKNVYEDASRRVDKGQAHICLAVVYPPYLVTTPFANLKTSLESSEIEVAVLSEIKATVQLSLMSEDTPREVSDFFYKFHPGDLSDILRTAFDHLIEEDIVSKAVEVLEIGVETFLGNIEQFPEVAKRISKTLGINQLPKGKLSHYLSGVSRISALVLLNAIIFQEILSRHECKVNTLQQTISSQNPAAEFSRHWQQIVAEINYYPIFHLATEILNCLPSNLDITEAMQKLVDAAQKVVILKAAFGHDLMGRIFHRWLLDAKYLGAYYTKIPSAILLLKLALCPSRWNVKWNDIGEIRQFRLADLACGTGTLLMAASSVLADNFIRGCAATHEIPDTKEFYTIMGEEVLHGYDVVPSALHITASTIAMLSPDTIMNKMNLFLMPFGGKDKALGSIEFAKASQPALGSDFFNLPTQIETVGTKTVETASLPQLDLCVMNPPFSRSVVGNLLFGSLPEKERQALQKKLKKTMHSFQANITAGLGSVFVAIGEQYVKQGGRMALVLPKSVLSGVAWAETRSLLTKNYFIEFIVVSYEPQKWNFSENTDLSEVLIVARKKMIDEEAKNKQCNLVILWHRPETTFEALAVAYEILRDAAPDLETKQGAQVIRLGNQCMGEVVSVNNASLADYPNWLIPCGFAQSDLSRVAIHLLKGKLKIPGNPKVSELALCPLSAIGSLGPDQRDVVDGFDTSSSPTMYSAMWGHKSDDIKTLSVEPNKWLTPLSLARKGRKLKQAEALWPQASNIMIASRLRLNLIACVSIRLNREALGISWWPFRIDDDKQSVQAEKALALWLNSTLGLILLLVNRVEQHGPWINLKKPSLHQMPVLDIRELSSLQLEALARDYDRLASSPLLPLSNIKDDITRVEIDKAISSALNLSDVSILRSLISQEPNISLKAL